MSEIMKAETEKNGNQKINTLDYGTMGVEKSSEKNILVKEEGFDQKMVEHPQMKEIVDGLADLNKEFYEKVKRFAEKYEDLEVESIVSYRVETK